ASTGTTDACNAPTAAGTGAEPMRWRGGCTMDGGAGGANGMRSRARARVRQLAPSSGRRRRAPPARAGVMAITVLLLGSALAATPALAESAGDLNAAAHALE